MPGRLRDIGQRQGVEVRLHVGIGRLGVSQLPGATAHPEHPLAHRQEEATMSDRLVQVGVRRRYDRDDGLQMWRVRRCGQPLGARHTGAAGHADVAVAPLLGRDPLDDIVAVVRVVDVGCELTVRIETPTEIIQRDDVAASRQFVQERGATARLVVRRAQENDRVRSRCVGSDQVK